MIKFREFITESSHEVEIKKRMEKIAKKMKEMFQWGIKSPMPKYHPHGFDLKKRGGDKWKIEFTEEKPAKGAMFVARAMEIITDTSDKNLEKVMKSVMKKAKAKRPRA
jgi:hypothetical protein